MSTERIEKSIFLRAPRAEVWKAISDAGALREWFGVDLNGPLAPGAHLGGKVTHQGYEDSPFEISICLVEPEHRLSWNWHPHAVDSKRNYSSEPTTLVTFELEATVGGTWLTVVESGFESIPLSRRVEAYRANDEGWQMQMASLERYIRHAA